MNRFLLLLFGMVTFVAHAQDTLLVEEFTMTFESYFEYETQVLELDESYFMTIDGQYNISSGTYGHKDAAWYFCYSGCSGGCNSNTPCPSLDEDNWNASITSLRPDVDVYDPNHHYEYSITGEGAPMIFDFNDVAFGDNGGALVIAIHAIINQIEGCTDHLSCNFDPTATEDDGSCIPSGCLDANACNFNSLAQCEGEACDYSCCPGPGCCGEGTTWNWQTSECDVTNPSDSNFDGCVELNDLLDLLSAYGDCGAEESPWQCGDPLEYQGYDYQTVQIGEQCWFAENLRAENYRNGEAIPTDLGDSEWAGTAEGAVSVYDGDIANLNSYGRLYNWYAVDDDRGLCPNSWHVTTDGEWTLMTDFLGGQYVAGDKMKTTYGWSNNGNGMNSSGFSGLPGGVRNDIGAFYYASFDGLWWSSSPDFLNAWNRGLYFDLEGVYRYSDSKSFGLSVRCIKDAE